MLRPFVLALSATSVLAQSQQTQQLPFNSPQTNPTASKTLVQLEFASTDHAQLVFDKLQEEGHDIWARKSTQITLPLEESFLTSSALSLELAQQPTSIKPLSSIEDLLAEPTVATDYSRQYSHSLLQNITHPDSSIRRAALLGDEIHQSFHPYDEGLVPILQALADEFPTYAQLVSVGNSSEGRPVWGLKITNSSHPHPHKKGDDSGEEDEDGDEDEEEEVILKKGKGKAKKGKGKKKKGKKGKKEGYKKKLGFVVSGTQHSREWIAGSTTLFAAQRLLLSTLEEETPLESRLINVFEFLFVPVVNVDGYVYTWENDRLWRKNRQDVGEGCFGVDLNRQWGYKFSPGNRPNPCSDAYPGTKPFEAPELQGLVSYMQNKTNNVVGFVDLHSFGQMLMFPWSYSCKQTTSDDEDLFEAAVGAAKALRSVHGRSFEVGSVCQVSLTSPGESLDWTYGVAKITWSFAFELRGGVYGFLLPPSQILPSGEETLEALYSLADFVGKKEIGKKFRLTSS
ncbi:hypothetical protein T439DRAFT_382494 [Meredithblackwellia eburnea MCA 4105]